MSLFVPFLIGAPLIAGIVASMVMATQMFQQSYMETLCRIESVRTHALEKCEPHTRVC